MYVYIYIQRIYILIYNISVCVFAFYDKIRANAAFANSM